MAKCEATGKNIWASEIKARRVARDIFKQWGGVRAKHFYQCDRCKGWHYSKRRDSNVFAYFGTYKVSRRVKIMLRFNPKYVLFLVKSEGKMRCGTYHNPYPNIGPIIRKVLVKCLYREQREDLITNALQWYWNTLGMENHSRITPTEANHAV